MTASSNVIPLPAHLNAAQAYARRGWYVFPVYEPKAHGCSCRAKTKCRSPGKHPRLLKGYRASVSTDTIKEWWTEWPNASIAISPQYSSLIVLDIDPRNNGDAGLAGLEAKHEPLPETVTALTGGGGQHYYFIRPPSTITQHMRSCVLAQGVEVKADSGYVIAPPSKHCSGKSYTWDAGAHPDDIVPAMLPNWLLELIGTSPAEEHPEPIAPVTEGLMGAACAAAGLIDRYIGLDKATCQCPWESEHTGGHRHDGSTIVFAPRGGSRQGWFHCSHAHCARRTQEDVLNALPEKAVAFARAKLSFDPDARPGNLEQPDATRRNISWRQSLRVNEKGQLTRDVGNIALILANESSWEGVFYYDATMNNIFLGKKPPNVPGMYCPAVGKPINDAVDLYVSQWFARARGVSVPARSVREAICSAAHLDTRDPLRDYLQSLQWDGRRRIAEWLIEHFGTRDTPFCRFAAEAWLIGAVARALEPGCQADYVLVLEGYQGIGKTSALRILGGKHYLGSLPDIRNKDAMVAVAGKWIVEIGELDAIRGVEQSRVKDFLSQTIDVYRPPYARTAVAQPRRCVFGGTTNEKVYLHDHTGARRFWPIRCFKRLNRERLAELRDQLWAEAVVQYESGVPWHPTLEMERKAGLVQADRRECDPWEEVLNQYIRCHPADAQFTNRELWEFLGYGNGALGQADMTRVDKRASSRLGRIMRTLGYVSQKVEVEPPDPDRPQRKVTRWVASSEVIGKRGSKLVNRRGR